jgi:hypothetical protein
VKRPKTPQQKKALSYAKDRRVGAEYPHAFRRYWPRKEAHASRQYRRGVRQSLVHELRTLPAEALDDIAASSIRREEVRKWGPNIPLGQRVPDRLSLRVVRTASNFFNRPYVAERDHARFVALLASLSARRTSWSREQARAFNMLLDPPEYDTPVSHHLLGRREQRQEWLRAFFADEPAWEQRIRAWVRSQLGPHDHDG